MKNVIIVPVGEDALSFCDELREWIQTDWVFLHKNIVGWLEKNAKQKNNDAMGEFEDGLRLRFTFETHLSIILEEIRKGPKDGQSVWFELKRVNDGIVNVAPPMDPMNVLFFEFE